MAVLAQVAYLKPSTSPSSVRKGREDLSGGDGREELVLLRE